MKSDNLHNVFRQTHRHLNTIISAGPFLNFWKVPAVIPEKQISLISTGKYKNPPHFVIYVKFL